MKKIYVTFLILFSCAKVEFPWHSENLETILINNEKLIMIDFYATW